MQQPPFGTFPGGGTKLSSSLLPHALPLRFCPFGCPKGLVPPEGVNYGDATIAHRALVAPLWFCPKGATYGKAKTKTTKLLLYQRGRSCLCPSLPQRGNRKQQLVSSLRCFLLPLWGNRFAPVLVCCPFGAKKRR